MTLAECEISASGSELPVGADAASTAANSAPRVLKRPCPLCAGTSHSLLFCSDPWRLVACSDCGLAYLPEIPAPEAIEDDFEWSQSFARTRAARWAAHPLMRFWTFAVFGLKPSRDKRALRQIRRVTTPGRLLDVGCGDGRLAAVARRSGFDPIGIELSPRMAARARRRVGNDRILCGRLEDFEFATGSFDAAVTVSYLEHEPRPLEVLRRLHGLVRPGGVCIHKVPNFASLLRRVLGRRWSGYRFPEHMQYYTPQTLSRLVEQAGFTTIRISANPLGDNFWLAGRRP